MGVLSIANPRFRDQSYRNSKDVLVLRVFRSDFGENGDAVEVKCSLNSPNNDLRFIGNGIVLSDSVCLTYDTREIVLWYGDNFSSQRRIVFAILQKDCTIAHFMRPLQTDHCG